MDRIHVCEICDWRNPFCNEIVCLFPVCFYEYHMRLHSCSWCGRIHDKGPCPMKHTPKQDTEIDRFRSSKAWQDKRDEIKKRDHYLCQVCIRSLYSTRDRLTHENLSVHHVISITEDYDRRLDNDILLTICGYHHEMAESGSIPRAELLRIAEEQEGIPPGI